EKDQDDAVLERAEDPEAEAVEPRRPALAGRDGGHHLGARLADEARDGNDLEAAGAQALNDDGQGAQGFGAVAAAVVQQDDVAAALVAGLAGREMAEEAVRAVDDVFGGRLWVQFPVVRVELGADGDV